jgi:hypothetical protein
MRATPRWLIALMLLLPLLCAQAMRACYPQVAKGGMSFSWVRAAVEAQLVRPATNHQTPSNHNGRNGCTVICVMSLPPRVELQVHASLLACRACTNCVHKRMAQAAEHFRTTLQ